MEVSIVLCPPTRHGNTLYTSNRAPLQPNALIKLPVGAVRPKGWLRHQLDLMADGMTGHLSEISAYLKPGHGWFGCPGEGWEEPPYWLRGFYSLGVLTGDARVQAEAARWMDGVLTSTDEEGYFGAGFHKHMPGKDGHKVTDLWQHMVMLDAVIRHYEHTQDPRVIPLMTRFFQFCRALPEDEFLPGRPDWLLDWRPGVEYDRAGDMLPHIYWLYNRTGESWLLDLATRFFQHIKPSMGEWMDGHVVNFTQRFQYSGCYHTQSGAQWQLDAAEYWYTQHMGTWGQQPRGIFGADEQLRPGCLDPRQAIETCAMVEFAKSFYLLGGLTGDTRWADRCEDVMLNHFPAASTPDLKALHYLTASNQPQLDASENHEYANKGRQIDYSPHLYRCCQHNVAMGWPWYAEHLWQATADNGLAAWLYASCEATAQVGERGDRVTLETETGYPFDGQVAITVKADVPVAFPLYLRIPRWCHGLSVSLNGTPLEALNAPGTYLCIERTWSPGDTVVLDLQMALSLTRWPRNGSVSVDRGPLSYSLRIGERWNRVGGTDAWPEWEVLPTTPWNYGLVLDEAHPEESFEVTTRRLGAAQPWMTGAAPIEIRARGRRIPGWQLENETAGELPVSPVHSAEPVEPLTLIPLGCARLRIGCLPVVAASLPTRSSSASVTSREAHDQCR
jgi:DUF1680 family protein